MLLNERHLRLSQPAPGQVDDLSFFDYLNQFCFLLIKFH